MLGLLAEKPRTGYELQRAIERSIGYFWAPARSQTYAVLPRLVAEGLATARRVDQETRPAKRIYTLTEAGREALRAWLAVPPEPVAAPRDELLVKLFLGQYAQPEDLAAHVRGRLERAREELEVWASIEQRIDVAGEDFYGYLTLLEGIESSRARVRWAEQALALLEERQR